MFEIYTDGGCNDKRRIGACAYLIIKDGIIWHKGRLRFECSDANEAEFAGASRAIAALPDGSKAVLRTDSNFNLYAYQIHHSQTEVEKWLSKYDRRHRFASYFDLLRATLKTRRLVWQSLKKTDDAFHLWCHSSSSEFMHQLPDRWWACLNTGDVAESLYDSAPYLQFKIAQWKFNSWSYSLLQRRRLLGLPVTEPERTLALIEKWRKEHSHLFN